MNPVKKKQGKSQQANKLISLLNQDLANAIDLKLQAKQAHWNLKGENFIALHELFDKVATEVDGFADMLAERVVQLGGIAQGTLQAAAATSQLKSYPKDIQRSILHVAALGSAIETLAESERALIEAADEVNDAVTADICTEIARGLDMLHWFVEAHNY